MSRNRIALSIITVVLPMLIVACASAPTVTPLPTVSSTQPGLQLPLGMYENSLMKRGLELLEGNQYNAYMVGVVQTQGTYTVTQDQVVFIGTTGVNVCTVPGTYKWAFDGKALTLTEVQDGCTVRKDTWTQGSWIKQPQTTSAVAPTSTPIAISFELVSIIKADPKLFTPAGIVVDKQGNLYVMDAGNSRVVKFGSDGKLLTTWGARGESDGQFNVTTHGGGRIAVDGQGNIYVGDSSSRIQKFDSNGKFLTKWGSKGDGDGQFLTALGVAVDSQGNVYTTDGQNNRVEKFDSNGKFLLKWGGKGTGDAELFLPLGLKVDEAGNVYFTERLNSRIQKFDSNGKSLAKFFIEEIEGKFVTPGDLAVDSQGNFYVTDTANNRVVKLDSSGKLIAAWGSPGTGDSQFDEPWGVAVDASGNVYVVDSVNGRIEKFRQK